MNHLHVIRNVFTRTAAAGSDYTAATGSVTFAPGVTTATWTIGITDDVIYEQNETFTVGLSGPVNATLGAPSAAVVTIVDNETPPAVALSAATYSVAEQGGAVVVTAGAQGTKKLGIDGEEAIGVYHAKDVVYHFNSLPPFAERAFEVGRRVAIIGMGNVMDDIANWLLNLKKIDQVVVVARRGPLEKAYDDSEFEYIDMYLDNADMKQERSRHLPSQGLLVVREFHEPGRIDALTGRA